MQAGGAGCRRAEGAGNRRRLWNAGGWSVFQFNEVECGFPRSFRFSFSSEANDFVVNFVWVALEGKCGAWDLGVFAKLAPFWMSSGGWYSCTATFSVQFVALSFRNYFLLQDFLVYGSGSMFLVGVRWETSRIERVLCCSCV